LKATAAPIAVLADFSKIEKMQLKEDDISWRVDAAYKCFSTSGSINEPVKKFSLKGMQTSCGMF
jgi:hypothetical protein